MANDFSNICIYILYPGGPGADLNACTHTDITSNPDVTSYRYANGDSCPYAFPDA